MTGSAIRRFVLHRHRDVSGVSGTGVVAEGAEFTGGQAVLKWLTNVDSIAIYPGIAQLMAIHGHGGCTTLEWCDEP